MSTKLIFKTTTSSGEETRALSKRIGKRLRGAEVFAIYGDLGFGKTQFVKGLVEGIGIKEEVTSPSFTITNIYAGEDISVYHMDFYRINEPGVLKDELKEIIEDIKNITVIEWPEVISRYLPEMKINVTIRVTGDNLRDFSFEYPEQYKYLFEDLA